MTTLPTAVAALRDTLVREHRQAPGLFREIARMEELLADTYRDRVPYELLQNSDDAGARSVLVEDLGDGRFRWGNDGRPLDAADVEALCRSANSTKTRGGDSIGYRGIGFKSLAAIAHRIDVRSAGVRFAFDRTAATALLGEVDASAVPLIRIPAEVRPDAPVAGVTFTVTCRRPDTTPAPSSNTAPPSASTAPPGAIDPLSALFLRNVTHIRTPAATGPASGTGAMSRTGAAAVSTTGTGTGQGTPTAPRDIHIERDATRVVLRVDGAEAAFALLRHGAATVAVPLDARALAMTGVRGRLACFLPLQDEVGLPVVISGDLLTDPSRTHAVTADASTRQVLADAAHAIARRLCAPGDPTFERLWQLVLDGEDLRSVLISGTASAGKLLVSALREEMTAHRPPFAHSPLPLEPGDVRILFPGGAPQALYAVRHQAAARALKAVLGLRGVDFTTALADLDPTLLSDPLRARLAAHLQELARTHGRKLTAAESRLVQEATSQEEAPTTTPPPTEGIRVPKAAPAADNSLASVLKRWRAAELATKEYLNHLGWTLRDVSTQNVGYDLEGTDPQGQPVRVEVKKVDRPDARFAMTNNEMSLMLTQPGGYLLAIVVGDGRHAQLLLLDPSRTDLPKERVCRRWDWEFTDWSRFAKVAGGA
ncbi:sacsin N-terminal ATP-binding-like domain-containing protein [Streptomyces buecherae]|uniref:sacsin N-terminal ATP-binding-like domain-containing protein n=1 Tax=Streptomyces buecherae TaxID=2763006 RepID=UPI0036572096